MGLFKRLYHRHTWRVLKTEYRYPDRLYGSARTIAVKRCQCRICGEIAYLHFDGKNVV